MSKKLMTGGFLGGVGLDSPRNRNEVFAGPANLVAHDLRFMPVGSKLVGIPNGCFVERCMVFTHSVRHVLLLLLVIDYMVR